MNAAREREDVSKGDGQYSYHYSKQPTSRADRDTSPKRISFDNLNLENSNAASPNRKYRRWFQDALPLKTAVATDSKSKQDVLNKGSKKKPEEPLDVTQQSSNPTKVPRSRSYFQHDEHGSAGQGGRSFNRREHGRTDPKDRFGDGAREKLVALKLPSQLIFFSGGSKPKVAAIVGCCDCRWRRS